jgi:hypothetical protein
MKEEEEEEEEDDEYTRREWWSRSYTFRGVGAPFVCVVGQVVVPE